MSEKLWALIEPLWRERMTSFEPTLYLYYLPHGESVVLSPESPGDDYVLADPEAYRGGLTKERLYARAQRALGSCPIYSAEPMLPMCTCGKRMTLDEETGQVDCWPCFNAACEAASEDQPDYGPDDIGLEPPS